MPQCRMCKGITITLKICRYDMGFSVKWYREKLHIAAVSSMCIGADL